MPIFRLHRLPARLLGTGCLLLVAGSGVACSREEPEHGQIVGDHYLVMASGREVNFGSHPVHLLPETATLDSLLTEVCVRRQRELTRADPPQEGGGSQSPSRGAEAWQEREQLLRAQSARVVRTDTAAQFRIDSIPPGEYRLWSDATVEGERWTWLEPVEIGAGDSIRVNLSNANPDEDPFRCQELRRRESSS